jgi:hypothetical protein
MLEWKVRYYNGTLELDEITSNDMAWEELPTSNVIEVDILKDGYRHTLRGMDNYWLSGSYYGMFNNTGSLALYEEEQRRLNGHQEVEYGGTTPITYKWETTHIKVEETVNLTLIHILSGVMVPDEHAREFGLI